MSHTRPTGEGKMAVMALARKMDASLRYVRVTAIRACTAKGFSMKCWIARLLVITVLGINLECGLAFLWQPGQFSPAFELQGAVGVAMLRGLGVLFVMWNIPYLVAAFHLYRHRISLLEALAMQAIGLLGETWIAVSLPAVHRVARASLARFILFDGLGLVALLVAAWITWQRQS